MATEALSKFQRKTQRIDHRVGEWPINVYSRLQAIGAEVFWPGDCERLSHLFCLIHDPLRFSSKGFHWAARYCGNHYSTLHRSP